MGDTGERSGGIAGYGALMSDAAMAAMAMECGATLASTDLDFTRFEGLKWINPVAASALE